MDKKAKTEPRKGGQKVRRLIQAGKEHEDE